ncbi:MAG: Vps62-related protein, partial [Thermoplasmatales archaeon]|nr:Vps62-related protein [Thermoplasmatales archaeon]
MKGRFIICIVILTCFFSFGNFIDTVRADDNDIAQQYAPIFYFEKDETCYPVNISYHIDNSYLYRVGQQDPIKTSPSIDNLPIDNNDYYLDNKIGSIDDNGIINDYKLRNLGYTVYSNVNHSGDLT